MKLLQRYSPQWEKNLNELRSLFLETISITLCGCGNRLIHATLKKYGDRTKISPMLAILIILAMTGGVVNASVCPPVGSDSDCGVIITVTDKGASVLPTGQGPYDGIEDTLVGVVNNSSQPIYAIGLTSILPIFGFDGDGIVSYGVAGNILDSTGYGGPNAYFDKINADGTSGVVKFIIPIAVGGTGYFSLEDTIVNAVSCRDVVSRAVTHYTTDSNTSIVAEFTPNKSYSLSEAARYCGFTNFNWIQQIVKLPDPSPFYAYNNAGTPIHLTSASTPFNDPPEGGGYTSDPADYSYPFYLSPHELLSHEIGGYTLSMEDQPRDSCLPGGNSVHVHGCDGTNAVAGSYIGFRTDLAGMLPDGSPLNLGIGFSWTTTFNARSGGIATTKNLSPVDPHSGTGGITVTDVNEFTDYEYQGVTVSTINGKSIIARLVSGLEISTKASGLSYSRVSQTFNGKVTITNISSKPINGPLQIVFSSLTPSVSLVGASGNFGGSSYLTVPSLISLGSGQSATVNIKFLNHSNVKIDFTPVIYSGSFN